MQISGWSRLIFREASSVATLSEWKKQLTERESEVFQTQRDTTAQDFEREREKLHQNWPTESGERFLKKKLQETRDPSGRLSMVEPDHSSLSVRRQCRLLKVPRSTLYYKPRSATPENLALMRRIDQIHLEDPSAGSRRIAAIVRREGEPVNRKRVQRLMRVMEIELTAPRRRTTIAGEPSRVKPYLLGGVEITDANHVWCTDITYIPMRQGILYLCVVMDWATRKVLGWCLSNTQDTGMCLCALEMALETTGCQPEILNSDQGTQICLSMVVSLVLL